MNKSKIIKLLSILSFSASYLLSFLSSQLLASRFWLLGFLASWILSFPSIVRAQSIGFSIYPPILESVIKPGKIITQVFTIRNLSDSDKVVVARIVPFVPDGDSGTPLLKPNLKPGWLSFFSLANSFIDLGKPFLLPANKSEQLILNIVIPVQAEESDYYSSLILSTNLEEPNTTQPSNSIINTTIGANILLTINQKVNPPTIVRVRDFAPYTEDILYRYGDVYIADNLSPIRFRATAANEGRYLTKTQGLVSVTKNKVPVSLQGLIPLNLLANSSRELHGSPSGEIVFTPQISNFGTHKVELDLRSENSSSHNELILVLLPIKVGLTLFLVMIFMVTILALTKNPKQ